MIMIAVIPNKNDFVNREFTLTDICSAVQGHVF
jgi:hypothetical protein